MSTGLAVLIGVFAVGLLFLLWNSSVRRGQVRQLQDQGFLPTDLRQAADVFSALAKGYGSAKPRKYRFGSCLQRGAGRGIAYYLSVVDETNADRERDVVGGAFNAFLIELRDPARIVLKPVSVYIAPEGSGLLQKALRQLIALDPIGHPLEIDPGSSSYGFLGAFGDGGGSLSDSLPPPTPERLARASALGFFAVHFGREQAAFLTLPSTRDIAAQWAYVAEWV